MSKNDQSPNEGAQSKGLTSFLPVFSYRQVFSVALIPIGLLIIRSSRQTWIEVAVLDYKGTDDWYGKFTLAAGVALIVVGILNFIPSFPNSLKNIASWIGIAFSLISIIVLIVIAIRVDQIGDDLARKARAPERFFEGTILEGLGRILANVSETISSLGRPKVASGWRSTTIFTVCALVSSLLANDWSRNTDADDESSENLMEI